MTSSSRFDDLPAQSEVEWASRYAAGETLAGKYRLEELLGEGGMGAVWRARHLALDCDVAVKLLHEEDAGRDTSERLEREAHAAARLEHPFAVRVFDLGKTELGDPFIVMELLRGENLRELFDQRGAIPAEEIVPLLLPIASALAAAHDKGIVHRDLKPENIVLVAHEGKIVPKVVDFGIAKIEAPRSGRNTTQGTIMGSPAYMSPEQASGDLAMVDARTDVWALGVVLHEAVAGAAPFAANHPLALLRAVIEDEPPPLPKGTDADFARLIDRALAKKASDRWPDLRAFGRALATWAIDHGIAVDASGGSIAASWLRPEKSVHDILTTSKVGHAGRTTRKSPPAPSRIGWGLGIAVAVVAVGLGAGLLRGRLVSSGAVPAGEAMGSTSAPGASSGATASASTPGPSNAAATPILVTSGSTSAAAIASSPAAASSPAIDPTAATAPLDTAACVVALWPSDAFEADAPLTSICGETDPRKGASFLRGEITRHGLLQRKTTDAMRAWSILSWYELAAFTATRHRCCPAEPPLRTELPPPIGTCPALGPALDALGQATRAGAPDVAALTAFREAVACEARGQQINGGGRGAYAYDGPPHSGAESAFVRLVAAGR